MNKIYSFKKIIFGFLIVLLSSLTAKSYNLLVLESGNSYSDNMTTLFTSMGHSVTQDVAANLNSSYDYSSYDVVVFGYNTPLPNDLQHLLDENIAGNIGVLIGRGDAIVDDFDLAASAFWTAGTFTVTDNSHAMTSSYTQNETIDLSFDYGSGLIDVTANTTTLATLNSLPSLVIHNIYKRIVMPYYGHGSGMPWSAEAEVVMNNSITWAAGGTITGLFDYNISDNSGSSVWPNPSVDYIQFESDFELVTIVNLNGEIVKKEEGVNKTVNVSDLEPGLYLISGTSLNGGVQMSSFHKQ